jgi:aspartate/methionine/tyrosine aminotransferase
LTFSSHYFDHPHSIPKAYEWAERYDATPSKPLIDMSQGVPGIPPPEELRKAISEASFSPKNFSYCRWDGERSLRLALSEEMRTVYGTQADITPEDIALTAGCNMAFMAAIMALADAEDEVILPYPW